MISMILKRNDNIKFIEKLIGFTVISLSVFLLGCEESRNSVPSNPDNELLIDPALLGKWFTETVTTNGISYGISIKTVLNVNGTGYSVALKNNEIMTEEFRWAAENQILKIYNNASGMETSGFYTVCNNIHSFTYEEPTKGYYVEQISIKNTGGIDNRIIGTWAESSSCVGGVPVYYRQFLTLNENGAGSIQAANESKIESELFEWSTTANRILFENSPGLSHVSVYNIDKGNLSLSQFNTLGELSITMLIQVTTEIDTALIGIWVLESRTIDGVPSAGSAVMHLDGNGKGSFMESDDYYTFTWAVNNNKLIITETNGSAPNVLSYSIEYDSTILTYFEMSTEGSRQTFIEVYSRQED